MKRVQSRQVTFVLLTALAVGASSLLVPTPAPAAEALFRVERQFYNAPFPAITTPGGAGRYIAYVEPYTSTAPPGTAIVNAGNFVGSPFTLPSKSIIDFMGTYTITAKTAYPGYSTVSVIDYFIGSGRFKPNFGASAPTRVVFPTTMGNSAPNPANTKNINEGSGNPTLNAVTTTFDGRYDFSRAGSIDVVPGPNRFGGTMRLLYYPSASWYQYIFKYAPTTVYKAYADIHCYRAGVKCTADPSGPFGPSYIGEIYEGARVTRFLLNVAGTGTMMGVGDNTAKATNPVTENGTAPTAIPTGSTATSIMRTAGTENGGPASYDIAKNHYLYLIHPWTTGSVMAYNYLETPVQINPQAAGYDTTLNGVNLTITQIGTDATYNSTQMTVTYMYETFKQYLTGVKRVVSMVRPKLTHVYLLPLDDDDPIITSWANTRLWLIRVFFVPEPTGLAMIGAGIAALLGLSRLRRH
jgi:hypothetical protein